METVKSKIHKIFGKGSHLSVVPSDTLMAFEVLTELEVSLTHYCSCTHYNSYWKI